MNSQLRGSVFFLLPVATLMASCSLPAPPPSEEVKLISKQLEKIQQSVDENAKYQSTVQNQLEELGRAVRTNEASIAELKGTAKSNESAIAELRTQVMGAEGNGTSSAVASEAGAASAVGMGLAEPGWKIEIYPMKRKPKQYNWEEEFEAPSSYSTTSFPSSPDKVGLRAHTKDGSETSHAMYEGKGQLQVRKAGTHTFLITVSQHKENVGGYVVQCDFNMFINDRKIGGDTVSVGGGESKSIPAGFDAPAVGEYAAKYTLMCPKMRTGDMLRARTLSDAQVDLLLREMELSFGLRRPGDAKPSPLGDSDIVYKEAE